MIARYLQDVLDVIAKTQLLERLLDVLTGNGFLGLLLSNFVGFAADHGDELDTAFYKQIAGISGESDAAVGFGGEDLGDDFGDGSFGEREVIGAYLEKSGQNTTVSGKYSKLRNIVPLAQDDSAR